MTDHPRPTLWGWVLPEAKTVVWGTILISVAAYFIIDRAAANLLAIVGAVLLTVILYKREKMK